VEAGDAVAMSRVPHQVSAAWGTPLGSGGARGLTLVVAPGLPTAQLEQLLRDAVSHHEDADVLTVKIYDSEEATRYDRHSDGGEFAERHLVASASRHRALGVESLALRGVEIGR
jgi:hypothetical protein